MVYNIIKKRVKYGIYTKKGGKKMVKIEELECPSCNKTECMLYDDDKKHWFCIKCGWVGFLDKNEHCEGVL